MNYNLIISRLIQTLRNKTSSQPILCFKIPLQNKVNNCDCVDYCKYGPTPDNIEILYKFKEDKRQFIENTL